jgi:hypothetical protein
MSIALGTLWRVPRHVLDVECTVLDAPAGPLFAVRWSPVDEAVLESVSDARALMARSRRVRDQLVASGCGDLL